jgi:hypothetical protein
MNELFLYDRDAGLFKQILKLSTVIEGRYFVAPAGGPEMNTSSMGSYINDALAGITAVDRKYPCAICLPPVSIFDERDETIVFNLLFLTRSNHTGTNELKQANVAANVSTHHTWYDWKDMKECAQSFLAVLRSVIRNRKIGEVVLISQVNLTAGMQDIYRVSGLGNDNLNGVRVSFRMELHKICAAEDYSSTAAAEVVIPPAELHAHHKH